MQREWVRIRILESGSVNFYPDPRFVKAGSDPRIRTHQTCLENAIADKTGSGLGPDPHIKRMQREWVRIRILESGSVNFYPDPRFVKAGSDPRIRTHQTCLENAIADKTGSGHRTLFKLFVPIATQHARPCWATYLLVCVSGNWQRKLIQEQKSLEIFVIVP